MTAAACTGWAWMAAHWNLVTFAATVFDLLVLPPMPR